MTADPSSDEAWRSRVVRAAESWVGTPYRHQGRVKGAGADCLGLLLGVWAEAFGRAPDAPDDYAATWAECDDGERLIEAARRHLRAIDVAAARPGDVLAFRMREAGPAKHLGLLCRGGLEPSRREAARMIHAYSGRGVVASAIGPSWRRRIAAAFSFPE